MDKPFAVSRCWWHKCRIQGWNAFETTDTGRERMVAGSLDISGTGFRIGPLISPTLVLIAAHCLFDKTTDQWIDPARIELLAG